MIDILLIMVGWVLGSVIMFMATTLLLAWLFERWDRNWEDRDRRHSSNTKE